MGVWDFHPKLPYAEGSISVTRRVDETIVFDRIKADGTEQAGFLSSSRNASGQEQLGVRGRRPSGLIQKSEKSGEASIYLKGCNLCVPKGDGTAEVGQELQCDIKTIVAGTPGSVDVIASANLSIASMTIADDLTAYQKGGGYQLTLTPASAAGGGTTTVTFKDERGEIVTETFDLSGTTAQTTKNRIIDVMSVVNSGYSGGTVTITAAVAPTREVKHGYGKGVDTGGIGVIKAVIDDVIYFDL